MNLKDLLRLTFIAGRNYGHAMGTGRPTYGLSFHDWYECEIENIKKFQDLNVYSEEEVSYPTKEGVDFICKKLMEQ